MEILADAEKHVCLRKETIVPCIDELTREGSSMTAIKPYLAIFTALVLAIIVSTADILFPGMLGEIEQLTLKGCLIVVVLISLMQIVRIEKDSKSITGQLAATKERLGNEIKHRLWAEKTASEIKIKSQIIDENIPVMLAYFNTDLRCRYHNRIFRRWFGLTSDQIDDRLLEEFSGAEFSSAIRDNIGEILAGKTVHNERILKSTKGFPYIFTEQYIPHLDNKGKAAGFYTLHTPRAQEKSRIPPKTRIEPANQLTAGGGTGDLPVNAKADTTKAAGAPSKPGMTAARIAEAIEHGEFKLYCQKIAPLTESASPGAHYEILIRMNEEENNLMPPGSFLPLVDQFKMMPRLDRWIIRHIVQWLSKHPEANTVCCLNVARDTLRDSALPDFIREQLQETHIAAASLCFEVELADVEVDRESARIFTQKIRELGCLISLCSFGGEPESMRLLDEMSVDYLKIDGSIVCNILHDEDELAQLVSIHQFARNADIKTIAELVETGETAAKLKEIGIDFAQGFGIARPQPFEEIPAQS